MSSSRRPVIEAVKDTFYERFSMKRIENVLFCASEGKHRGRSERFIPGIFDSRLS